MRALLSVPGDPGRLEVGTVPDPLPGPGEVLVRTLEVGVCGTDRSLVEHGMGHAPEGSSTLVLGHEVVGEVLEGPDGWPAGTLVSATVRRPCGRCPSCAAGAMDACDTGGYRERGILGLHGFASDRFAEAPQNLVRVPDGLGRLGLLAEPASVCEKALRQALLIGHRHPWSPRRALVLGAGAIGTLSAILLRLREMEVTVVALEGRGTPQAEVARAIGAAYVPVDDPPLEEVVGHRGRPDLVVEASGSARSIARSLGVLGEKGVLALIGSDHGSGQGSVDLGPLSVDLVLHNQVLLGSLNAGAQDWPQGLADLARARARWPGVLERVVGLRVTPDRAREAFSFAGIKAALTFA